MGSMGNLMSKIMGLMAAFSSMADSPYMINIFEQPRKFTGRYGRVIINHNNCEDEFGRIVFITEETEFIGTPIYFCQFVDDLTESPLSFTSMNLERVEPNFKKVFKNVSKRRIKKYFEKIGLQTGYIKSGKNGKRTLYSYIVENEN